MFAYLTVERWNRHMYVSAVVWCHALNGKKKEIDLSTPGLKHLESYLSEYLCLNSVEIKGKKMKTDPRI